MKKCAKCGKVKPLDEFHRSSVNTSGRHPQCKECRRIYRTDRKPPKQLEITFTKVCPKCGQTKPPSEFYVRRDRPGLTMAWCKPCASGMRTERRRANPELAREEGRRAQLWLKYKMTWEQYEALLASQGGVCAIMRGHGYP